MSKIYSNSISQQIRPGKWKFDPDLVSPWPWQGDSFVLQCVKAYGTQIHTMSTQGYATSGQQTEPTQVFAHHHHLLAPIFQVVINICSTLKISWQLSNLRKTFTWNAALQTVSNLPPELRPLVFCCTTPIYQYIQNYSQLLIYCKLKKSSKWSPNSKWFQKTETIRDFYAAFYSNVCIYRYKKKKIKKNHLEFNLYIALWGQLQPVTTSSASTLPTLPDLCKKERRIWFVHVLTPPPSLPLPSYICNSELRHPPIYTHQIIETVTINNFKTFITIIVNRILGKLILGWLNYQAFIKISVYLKLLNYT